MVYGSETTTSFGVTASPQFTGTPTGTVTVTEGTTALCTPSITLASGTGTCPISSASLLPVGTYTVVAAYAGDTNFTGSSAFGFLTVTRAATTTTVTFSPASVPLGGEAGVTFAPKLTLAPATATNPTGSVTVTATNTSTNVVTTVCSLAATAANGTTTCSPTATLLPAGTYTIAASYPGDANFTGSAGTATGTLTVTKAASSSLDPHADPVGHHRDLRQRGRPSTYGVSFGSAGPAPTGTVTVA